MDESPSSYNATDLISENSLLALLCRMIPLVTIETLILNASLLKKNFGENRAHELIAIPDLQGCLTNDYTGFNYFEIHYLVYVFLFLKSRHIGI